MNSQPVSTQPKPIAILSPRIFSQGSDLEIQYKSLKAENETLYKRVCHLLKNEMISMKLTGQLDSISWIYF